MNRIYVDRVLYQLKKVYGVPLSLHETISQTTDYLAGTSVPVERVCQISRAIVLPRKAERDFVYDLTYIAQAKNFTYGGFFDQNDRGIILHTKDIPKDWTFKVGMWITLNNKKYNIVKFDDYDPFGRAVILAVKHVEGQPSGT